MTDQRVIDIIAAHRGRERGMVCDEGELWCDACESVIRDGDWAAHVVEALSVQRIAIVELPPGEVGTDVWANQAGGVTLRHDTDGLVSNFTMARARRIAAALLAAAQKAEESK
jgi:hypothetical protein